MSDPPPPRPLAGATTESAAPGDVQVVSLYESTRKIYPRSVHGIFSFWRWFWVWGTQIFFYAVPWLQWNGRQLMLFDIAQRQFYVFGGVFLSQDVFYLALLLIVCALGLFIWTAVGGRLWCGYACPQTVYSEIFLWIEELVEGKWTARRALDKEGFTWKRLRLRTAKHTLWIVFSLWTGFTFVGYFTPIRELGREVLHFGIGPWEGFWILFYGFATYGNAGWLREQVCKYMCPYARFQSAMFDPDTLVISYDSARGDPRGGRKRREDYKARGLGACIDCNICVQVCPTGIDIRKGLQYECIACGACIDGCNGVMDKMGYPRGLIRYTTENALAGHYPERSIFKKILRPRVLAYSAVLLIVLIAGGWRLWQRPPVTFDISRDRNINRLLVLQDTGQSFIENIYTVHLFSTSETPWRVRFSTDNAKVTIADDNPTVLLSSPQQAPSITLALRVPRDYIDSQHQVVHFRLIANAVDEHDNIIRQLAENAVTLVALSAR